MLTRSAAAMPLARRGYTMRRHRLLTLLFVHFAALCIAFLSVDIHGSYSSKSLGQMSLFPEQMRARGPALIAKPSFVPSQTLGLTRGPALDSSREKLSGQELSVKVEAVHPTRPK